MKAGHSAGLEETGVEMAAVFHMDNCNSKVLLLKSGSTLKSWLLNHCFCVGHGRMLFCLLVFRAHIYLFRTQRSQMNVSIVCQIQHTVGTELTHCKAVNNLSGVVCDLFCFKLYLRGRYQGLKKSFASSINICICFFVSLFF